MTPQSIKSCFGYTQFTAAHMWRYLNRLTLAQLNQEIAYLDTSIRSALIDHINFKRRWTQMISGFTPPTDLPYMAFPTLKELKPMSRQVDAELMRYVQSLTQDELEDRITWQSFKKTLLLRHERWELLLYLANATQTHQMDILHVLRHEMQMPVKRIDMMNTLLDQDGSPEFWMGLPAM